MRGFFVAPFAVDGRTEGVGYREVSSLSAKWLGICAEFLDHHGGAFEAHWSGDLSHLRTKFTSAQGVAIATFYAHGFVVASLLLARSNDASESAVFQMFVDSLRKADLVRGSARNETPFSDILRIPERPIAFVVPWPGYEVSDQDHDLVRELSIHLAAAFLSRNITS